MIWVISGLFSGLAGVGGIVGSHGVILLKDYSANALEIKRPWFWTRLYEFEQGHIKVTFISCVKQGGTQIIPEGLFSQSSL